MEWLWITAMLVVAGAQLPEREYPRQEVVNDTPIIGILTMPDKASPDEGVLSNYYAVQFESFGARVLGISYDLEEDEL